MGPEVGGDADGTDEEGGAPGAVLPVGIEQGGAVLAARVEYVARSRLHRHVQTERVQPSGDPAGAGGEVGGERVEVHVVEGQADPVVPEVGEEGEGVVEAQVGEAVGAVPEAERTRGGSFPRLAPGRRSGTGLVRHGAGAGLGAEVM
ncbi:hypothetical protein SGRIM128S_09752 [Streptomyces griseomycini]